ncbi:unnamed protein product, partial [Prorocentrum cordatum]
TKSDGRGHWQQCLDDTEDSGSKDLLDGTRPGRRGNLAAAAAAAQLLETEGFRRPSWTDLLQGLRPEAPPRSEAAEPGEWQHGWQFHACSARNTHYRDNVFMPSLTRANQAMLRSGSGPRAAYWLHALPTTEGREFKPARFLAALRRRLSTMVSPLRRDGWHRPRTFDIDGAALLVAERRKRRRYHELTTGHSGRLMVLSCEVGGRWGRDSLQLVRLLAKQKARAAPALLRRSAELAYTNRWWGFLSVAAQDALMATLTGDGYPALGGAAGEDDPDLAEMLLADSAGAQGGSAGRAAGGGVWRREDRAVAGSSMEIGDKSAVEVAFSMVESALVPGAQLAEPAGPEPAEPAPRDLAGALYFINRAMSHSQWEHPVAQHHARVSELRARIDALAASEGEPTP